MMDDVNVLTSQLRQIDGVAINLGSFRSCLSSASMMAGGTHKSVSVQNETQLNLSKALTVKRKLGGLSID